MQRLRCVVLNFKFIVQFVICILQAIAADWFWYGVQWQVADHDDELMTGILMVNKRL
jgi:hypothetical protein